MNVPALDYIWVGIFGVLISTAELMTRYRDAPFGGLQEAACPGGIWFCWVAPEAPRTTPGVAASEA